MQAGKRALEAGPPGGDGSEMMAKRHQPDMDAPPSKVLLIRNLPRNINESEIKQALQPWTQPGIDLRMFHNPSTGQAFVEFPDEGASTHALSYIRQGHVAVRGVRFVGCYSTKQQVVTNQERHKDCRVLLVYVTNIAYPVELEVIHTIFSKYGFVEKIVSFQKAPRTYQALVQFSAPNEAMGAMVTLNGRNIYDGCNTLQVQPSKLSELSVRVNNSRSRDYTNPNLPTDEPPDERGGGIMGQSPNRSVPNGSLGSNFTNTPTSDPSSMSHHGHPSQYQGQGGHPGMPMSPFQQQFPNQSDQFGRLSLSAIPNELRFLKQENPNTQGTPVIMIYHLDPSNLNHPDKLFNLFSQFGVVERVKIFRDKPDTAMIQFSDQFYATLAQHHLHNVTVWNKTLQITFSRNFEVRLPPAGAETTEDMQRTKAYSQKEQRCSGGDEQEMQKYLKNVCKPSNWLFIGNLEDHIQEDDIRMHLSPFGHPKTVQFKRPQGPTARHMMAVVEMNSLEESFSIVMNCHNTRLKERSMKISFSKQGMVQ
ncbi:unnamed protein product [Vitrella brassicaformis CCMP3155]|uniref:RRM domain-containing protein n=1 Tax=Vitrella brassicaformis (strain CCMP3155) TaxID=1169540 RepID=A0A0G4ER99_VITBC|nr:unnamed protein product [Vitrella brassicaformis CCMP3155]|eukprot:CEL99796.1 unnamed protein product [Vitrella brassicaformis CCMP3155]